MSSFEEWFKKRLPEGIFANDHAGMKAAEQGFRDLLKEAYSAGDENGYNEGQTDGQKQGFEEGKAVYN